MTRESILEKVSKIITDYLGDDIKAEIKMDCGLRDNLGMDSMDVLYVVFMIENTFNICVESEKLETFTTVGDLVDIVKEKCK